MKRVKLSTTLKLESPLWSSFHCFQEQSYEVGSVSLHFLMVTEGWSQQGAHWNEHSLMCQSSLQEPQAEHVLRENI